MKKKPAPPKKPSYSDPASAFLSTSFAPGLKQQIAIKIKPPKKS